MRDKKTTQTDRARRLRRTATDAETKLWLLLRDRRLDGAKFLRQQPIGPYIVDFICRRRRLIVELDGGQHADNPNDVERDAWLRAQGYRVIRVWNNDMLQNPDGVLGMLAAELAGTPRPSPSHR
jgi:very-short-patch-repair endonuclease